MHSNDMELKEKADGDLGRYSKKRLYGELCGERCRGRGMTEIVRRRYGPNGT